MATTRSIAAWDRVLIVSWSDDWCSAHPWENKKEGVLLPYVCAFWKERRGRRCLDLYVGPVGIVLAGRQRKESET